MERVSNTVLLDAQVFEKISNDTNKIVAEQFQYPVELLEYTLMMSKLLKHYLIFFKMLINLKSHLIPLWMTKHMNMKKYHF